MHSVEEILGWTTRRFDGSYSSWNYNKDTYGSTTRFYEDGWREVIHKRDDHWTLSIGYEDQFSVGNKQFDTVKEAKEWADNRDMDDLYYLECVVNAMR